MNGNVVLEKRHAVICLNASYRILIGEEVDDYLISKKIGEYTDEDNWKDFIIDIFYGLPDIDLGIAEWVKQFIELYSNIFEKNKFQAAEGTNIKDILKIKTRDRSNPDLRRYLKNFLKRKPTRIIQDCLFTG